MLKEIITVIYFLFPVLAQIKAELTCNSNYLTDLSYICCNSNVLKPGLDLLNLPEKCIKQAEKCTVVGVTWDIYNCTITNELNGKPLTLDSFADIMVRQYPKNVVTSIKSLISSKSYNFDMTIEQDKPEDNFKPDDENYDNTLDILWKHRTLVAIRNAYYEIEKEIPHNLCLGKWACDIPTQPTTTPSKNKANSVPEHKCYSWIEENFRLGGCCNGVAIPLPIFASPHIPKLDVVNYTKENIMPIVGKYISYNLNLCYSTSYLVLTKKLNLDDLKKEVNNSLLPDYGNIADKLIPIHFNQNLKDEMKTFMTSDLIGNTNHSEFINFQKNDTYNSLFWHCAAHRILTRRVKDFDITPWCGNPLKETFDKIEDY